MVSRYNLGLALRWWMRRYKRKDSNAYYLSDVLIRGCTSNIWDFAIQEAQNRMRWGSMAVYNPMEEITDPAERWSWVGVMAGLEELKKEVCGGQSE